MWSLMKGKRSNHWRKKCLLGKVAFCLKTVDRSKMTSRQNFKYIGVMCMCARSLCNLHRNGRPPGFGPVDRSLLNCTVNVQCHPKRIYIDSIEMHDYLRIDFNKTNTTNIPNNQPLTYEARCVSMNNFFLSITVYPFVRNQNYIKILTQHSPPFWLMTT